MAPYNGKYRARLVDAPLGKRAYAFACPETLCDDMVFEARQVGSVAGKRLYAFASECWQWEDGTHQLQFVKQDWNPPFGISDRILFRIPTGVNVNQDLVECFGGETCPEVILEYNGSDAWTGSLTLDAGDLNISLTYNEPTSEWFVTFSGCVELGMGGSTQVHEAFVSCQWPWRASGQGLIVGQSNCCPSMVGQSNGLPFDLYSYTDKKKIARQVSRTGAGRRVFAYVDCCTTLDCNVSDCCECEVSPYQWSLPVSGVTTPTEVQCPCFNGNWTLTLNTFTGGECGWDSESFLSPCSSGPSAMWHLQCLNASRVYRLSTQNGFAAATYELGFDDWNCLGPNTLNRTFAVGCTGFPSTLTVTPV